MNLPKFNRASLLEQRIDRVYDRAKFRCAYTHKQESFDVLLHNIQLKEPSFYDEFLIIKRPASAKFFLGRVFLKFLIFKYKMWAFVLIIPQ